jgi:hypothetical protein
MVRNLTASSKTSASAISPFIGHLNRLMDLRATARFRKSLAMSSCQKETDDFD